MNDDNTTTVDGAISVTAIDACRVSDVAMLSSQIPLPDAISLCPQQELPSVDDEEAVNTYYVPCQIFPGDIPITSAMATDYTKIIMQSKHHYFIPGEHMHGSSGGVVVNRGGRAVGFISSGFVPGIKLPLPDSFKTLWETVSALPEGRGTYTRSTSSGDCMSSARCTRIPCVSAYRPLEVIRYFERCLVLKLHENYNQVTRFDSWRFCCFSCIKGTCRNDDTTCAHHSLPPCPGPQLFCLCTSATAQTPPQVPPHRLRTWRLPLQLQAQLQGQGRQKEQQQQKMLRRAR